MQLYSEAHPGNHEITAKQNICGLIVSGAADEYCKVAFPAFLITYF